MEKLLEGVNRGGGAHPHAGAACASDQAGSSRHGMGGGVGTSARMLRFQFVLKNLAMILEIRSESPSWALCYNYINHNNHSDISPNNINPNHIKKRLPQPRPTRPPRPHDHHEYHRLPRLPQPPLGPQDHYGNHNNGGGDDDDDDGRRTTDDALRTTAGGRRPAAGGRQPAGGGGRRPATGNGRGGGGGGRWAMGDGRRATGDGRRLPERPDSAERPERQRRQRIISNNDKPNDSHSLLWTAIATLSAGTTRR